MKKTNENAKFNHAENKTGSIKICGSNQHLISLWSWDDFEFQQFSLVFALWIKPGLPLNDFMIWIKTQIHSLKLNFIQIFQNYRAIREDLRTPKEETLKPVSCIVSYLDIKVVKSFYIDLCSDSFWKLQETEMLKVITIVLFILNPSKTSRSSISLA